MAISGIRVLVYGLRLEAPDFEVTHAERSQDLLRLAARDLDVVVTAGPHPAVLSQSSFELRKRWVAVPEGAANADVINAVESCYRSNLWGPHANQHAHPLVSIFTPTCNSGHYLRECYESLRAQTVPDWEWVVVDDCPENDTWPELENIAAHDHRVRPYRLGRCSGRIGETKWTATQLCRGDFLIELDHDDMLIECCVDEVRTAFMSNADVGFVYGNSAGVFEDWSPHQFGDDFWKPRYREIEWRGRKLMECRSPDIYDRFGPRYDQSFAFHLTVGPNHPRCFRASTFRELGGYNWRLPIADDWDAFARMFLRSKCLLIDKLLYVYRYRERWANTTFTKNKAIQDHLALGRQHYESEFIAFNDRRLAGAVPGATPSASVISAASPAPDSPADKHLEEVAFVACCRDEAAAAALRAKLPDVQHLYIAVGAKSILEGYEEGRLDTAHHRRVAYVHDDVTFRDLAAFKAVVATLEPGIHGVCGSATPHTSAYAPWWKASERIGVVMQGAGDEAKELRFSATDVARDAHWLDGLCLVTVDQQWSWRLPGDPPLWHGYDWLACELTRRAGGVVKTIPQPVYPLLVHAGYGREKGFSEAMATVRALSRRPEDRRDYPNIHEHLPRLEAEAHGVVLELGSRDGSSTGALLAGVAARGGEVWSVDSDRTCAEAWYGHPRWHFLCCDSVDIAALWAAGMPERIDVLFIDSEHTYEQARKELFTWLPHLAPGGVVLMHDTKTFPGVAKAAREAATQFKFRCEFLDNCNGLGVLCALAPGSQAKPPVEPTDYAVFVPPQTPTQETFAEVADALVESLQGLGYRARVVHEEVPGAKHIVLAAHLLGTVPEGSVLYNFEPVFAGAPVLTSCDIERFRSHEVWDYDTGNVAAWAALGVAAKHAPLGYAPSMTRFQMRPEAECDIDVLLYGWMNDRRREVATQLKGRGLNVVAVQGVYGQERDALIARSKVVLNVHYYGDRSRPEMPRLAHLLANGCCVVSEELPNWTAPCLMVSYDKLVERCEWLVHDAIAREFFGPSMANIFKTTRYLDVLAAVVGPKNPPAVTHVVAGPRVDSTPMPEAIPRQPGDPAIHLCFIAKDEEAALPGFIEHLRPHVDMMHMLDTGSTDGTVAVARSLGVHVVTGGPLTSFASARNSCHHAFSASGDWVVMFDPDERLGPPEFLRHLRELLVNTKYDVLMAPLTAVYPDGTRRNYVSKPFAYRRTSDARWVFRVHEKLLSEGRYALVTNAVIEHHLKLHDDARRARAGAFYAGLAREAECAGEVDGGRLLSLREKYPILDWEHLDDDRIAKVAAGPLVSVIIPTYRRLDLLRRAVASVLAQDYEPLEVHVVGDACPEVMNYKASDPRVHVHNLDINHGAGGAEPRNYGIAAAKGTLIAYLDDDNEWAPTHLSSVVSAMLTRGARWGFSSMRTLGADLVFASPGQGTLDTSCVVHERSLINEHGPWKDRTEVGYAHDWEFFSRFLNEPWVATRKPTLLYNAETSGQLEFLRDKVARALLLGGPKVG